MVKATVNADVVTRMQLRIAELEELLRPVARLGALVAKDTHLTDATCLVLWDGARLTYGDVRAAAKALPDV